MAYDHVKIITDEMKRLAVDLDQETLRILTKDIQIADFMAKTLTDVINESDNPEVISQCTQFIEDLKQKKEEMSVVVEAVQVRRARV